MKRRIVLEEARRPPPVCRTAKAKARGHISGSVEGLPRGTSQDPQSRLTWLQRHSRGGKGRRD